MPPVSVTETIETFETAEPAETVSSTALTLLELLLASGGFLSRREIAEKLSWSDEQVDAAIADLRCAGLIGGTGAGTGGDSDSDADGNGDAKGHGGTDGDGVFVPAHPHAALARVLEIQHAQLVEQLGRQQLTGSIMRALGDRLSSLDPHGAGGGPSPGPTQDSVPGSGPGIARGPWMRVLIGAEKISAALEDAAYRARREILSMYPGVPASGSQLAEGRSHNEWALRRGVTLRSIHLTSMQHVPHGRAHLRSLAESGVEVRLAEFLPFRAVVLDDVLAYTALRGRAGENGALELYGPEIGAMLREVFEYCWLNARPLSAVEAEGAARAAESEADDQCLFGRDLLIVRMLAEGRTDSAIARALGVSSRTLRRAIGSVMKQLGAESRFQAGLRAAELGLLRPDAPDRQERHPQTGSV